MFDARVWMVLNRELAKEWWRCITTPTSLSVATTVCLFLDLMLIKTRSTKLKREGDGFAAISAKEVKRSRDLRRLSDIRTFSGGRSISFEFSEGDASRKCRILCTKSG
jgi:hypothetical protein